MQCAPNGLQCADIVAKVFLPLERAILIQDQAQMRNVDSKVYPPRFDCCAFLFHSIFSATFATVSARSGRVSMSVECPLSRVKRTFSVARRTGRPDRRITLADYRVSAHQFADLRRSADRDRCYLPAPNSSAFRICRLAQIIQNFYQWHGCRLHYAQFCSRPGSPKRATHNRSPSGLGSKSTPGD